MVNEIKGNLLDYKGVLCHQTNFEGVMGAGVAAAIREQLLTDAQYADYQRQCESRGRDLLGTVLYQGIYHAKELNPSVYVANCFCQNAFSDSRGSLTNYGAMQECLKSVKQFAEQRKLGVYLPGFMGCGIAGGDWNRVLDIICDTFDNFSVNATIVYLGGR